ncbi:MAG: MATE family efflux transporter [Acidobacteriia bacterium]|nr:MATE family efflux transporter [Terriglobia bacterium]
MSPTPQPARHRIWRDIREAIFGSRQDFTEGSIGRAVLLLAVPMVLEMSMESLFAIVDVFFVARLGADAIATVGITEGMLTIVYGVAMGLSMATIAMVARRIGEKNPDGAAVAAVHSIVIGIVIAATAGVAGVWNAPKLLGLMGASTAIVRSGATYTAITFGGISGVFLLFLVNGTLRGAGDAPLAMRGLWIANAINIVLDPCLINGWGPFPRLGVTGAAVATTTGRGIGGLLQLYILLGGKGRIVFRREHFKLNLEVMTRLLRVSASGMMQFLVATASWLGLVRIIAMFGSAALAGYTIAIRIMIFTILPSLGMANAAATLVGQNLGARKPDRAERSVWLTGFYNMIFLGSVGLVFIVFAEPIVGLITSDAEVLRYATNCLRFVSYGYVFYAYGMVIVQAFNGAGDTLTPTVINLFCYWFWQIPMAYSLSRLAGFGPNGVFAAITIAESTLAVVAIVFFRRGKWKKQKI